MRVVDGADDLGEIVNRRGYLWIGIDRNVAGAHARTEPAKAKGAGQERRLQAVGRIADANNLRIIEVDQERISPGSNCQMVCASGSDAGRRVLNEIGPAII